MNQNIIRKYRVRLAVSCSLIFLFSFICLGCSSQTTESTGQEKSATIFKQGENAGDRAEIVIDGETYYFRWAPAGSFMMGSSEDEPDRDSSELLHQVTLTHGFWILETETTQKLWKSVMGDNPSKFVGDSKPVDTVSFQEVQDFLNKLSAASNLPEGARFLLPTEAQWEYAARAGQVGALPEGLLEKVAWFGDSEDGGTHDVAAKEPNRWGVYDMLGNLWEWTADKIGDFAKDDEGNGVSVVDPTGATDEETPADIRVDRGGCWDSHDYECRLAYRGYYDGDRKGPYVGFRFIYIPE